MKTILGIKGWSLSEYAISANAILGIRDSGKTYTATEAAEELYDAAVPFIAFDPIGVWHSLRVPGKGPGYPVVVAGGKQADLPLTRKNAGAIVRAAMSAEISLVLDLFSIDLSKSDWRSIVRECVEILLHENSEHGLRHVFIEEAAEFVPQRVQDGLVFAAVEKLVRMGGNSKLGCTLINQRSADLNKSVLELCANVFVHRQTGKNTLGDLRKWFDMLALDKDEQAKIADSLPDMKSGECWAFINDLKKPVRLRIPEKNSQHPDRRAVTAKGDVKRQAVPATAFVEQMRAKLAEKEKPKSPALPTSNPVAKINTTDAGLKDRDAAYQLGLKQGREGGYRDGYRDGHAMGFVDGNRAIQKIVAALPTPAYVPPASPKRIPAPSDGAQVISPPSASHSQLPAGQAKRSAPIATVTREANGLPGPQQRILDSLLTWNEMGNPTPSNAQVAWLASYSPSSSSYTNPRGALKAAGLVDYPAPDRVALTTQGTKLAGQINIGGDLLDYVLSQLPGPERRILEAAAHFHPSSASNEDVAARADYSASSSSFTNPRGALKSKELLTYPSPGQVRAADWLFQ